MNRREALAALLCALLFPGGASSQPPGSLPVVGLLITHPPADDVVVEFFRAGLRKYGYEEGKNLRLEVRTALGRLDRVPALAEELIRLPVDVLVVVNEVALHAARARTHTTPIVMLGFIDDPVSLGVIQSYSHPGGNITGVFNVNAALSAKRLEILKETLPNLARAAVLWDAFSKRQLQELMQSARLLRIRLDLIEVRNAQALEAAFAAAKARKAGAVIMNFSPVFWINRERIAAIAIDMGLPTISDMQILGYAGCLLAYGSDGVYNWERGAYFVHRILSGADPAALPVERLSKLTLVVNLKTARALGVTLPESILLRADEVIR